MSYFPCNIDAEGVAALNPDFVLDFTVSEDNLTLTFTLNPEARLAQRQPDHGCRLAGRRGTR